MILETFIYLQFKNILNIQIHIRIIMRQGCNFRCRLNTKIIEYSHLVKMRKFWYLNEFGINRREIY